MAIGELPDGATRIDPDEELGLIPSISTRSELNDFESENIRSAQIKLGESKQAIRRILEPVFLLRIHRLMFEQTWKWAGKTRTTEKQIGVEVYKIRPELQALCDDVLSWIENDSYPKAEIVARFHHRLVWIHPFPNGNGRFARFAADLLSKRLGAQLPTWGSADIDRSGSVRQRYINALQAADRHEIQPLIEFLYS